MLARNYEPSSTSNNPKPIDRISTSDDPQTMGSTATAIDVADTDIMDLRSDYGLMAHLILGLSIISTLSLPYMVRGQPEDIQEPGSSGRSGNALFYEPLQSLLPLRPVLTDSYLFPFKTNV